jgi:hypothetical protein
MSRTTLISALLGIFLTVSIGFQVYHAADSVADKLEEQQATVSAMFGV